MFASLILLVGCNDSKDPSAVAEERELPVQVAPVSFGMLSDSNQLTGTIVAESDVNIIPKASGEIKSILVKKGDYVKKGTVIAKLDDTAEQNAVKQQQTSLEQAKTSLESAKNAKARTEKNVKQSELSLQSAETALEQARLNQNDNLRTIEIQFKNAQSSYDQASLNLERMKALYNEGLISLQEYESAQNAEKNAKNALDQLEISKEQAERELNLKAQEAGLEQAQVNYEIAQSSISDADIGIEQAQIAVNQAQLALDSAKERLDDKLIKATISGEVTDVSGKVGEMASMASPFATIVALEKVKLNINISPNLLSSFKVGDVVNVQVVGIEEQLKGTVSYVSSVSLGYGLFSVEVTLNNQDKKISPGMVGSVIIEEIKQDNSLILPMNAIVQKEGKSVVFIVSEGKAIQKEVEILSSSTDLAAVTGDIKENDQVVISGQNLLDDGNKVQIMEED